MAVKFKDYYETLGVDRSSDADAIKKAYRKLARKYHPDVNPSDPSAEDRFKEVQEAYEVLGDPEKRKKYDTLGQNWKHGAEFTPPPGWQSGGFETTINFEDLFGGGRANGGRRGGFSDFFEAIFGSMGGNAGPEEARTGSRSHRRSRPSRPHTAEAELELPLERMHRGTTERLTVSVGGAQRTVDVRIPPGARDGSHIRVPRAGPRSGDLIIRLRMAPHARFQVHGDDTEVEVPVTPWEAALGATIQVPTLDGHADIRVPQGVASGQRIRLREQGPNIRKGGRGDHYVRLRIVVPKDLTPGERKHFEDLAKTSKFRPRESG
jgi:DnaJ-class molecular chaperone